MSSIMEALKKMEADEQADSGALLNYASPRRTRRIPFSAVLAMVFVSGVVVTAGGFYLVQTLRSDDPAATTEHSDSAIFRVVSQSKESPPAIRIKPSQAEQQPAIAQASLSKRASVEPASSAQSSKTSPQPAEKKAAPKVAEEIRKPSQDPVVEISTREVVAKKPSLPDYPAADTSTFHLQGLRWSETPSRCIAVINGQVLRQGGSVDGVKIVSILKNGVVLETPKGMQVLRFKR